MMQRFVNAKACLMMNALFFLLIASLSVTAVPDDKMSANELIAKH